MISRCMKNMASSPVLLVFFGSLTMLTLPASGQVEDFVTGTSLNFLTLRNNRLYYKADCAQGFAQSRIEMRPVESDRSTTLYSPGGCNTNQQIVTGLAVYGGSLFWVDGGKHVRKLDSYYPGVATPLSIATSPGSGFISENGPVTASAGFVYWTEEFTEFRNRSIIYRAPSAGGSAAVVLDFSNADDQWVKTMTALGDDRLIFLLSDGRLADARRRLLGVPPFQFYAWSYSLISSDAQAAYLSPDRVYWADSSSDGRSLFFRSAPLDATTNDTLLYWSFRSTPHAVATFVTDGTNLFFQDLTTASSGPLVRKNLTDSSAATEIATLLYPATHMVLTSRHVIWRKDDHTISRLPINAAAVTRDLAATTLEVLQVIQNTNNANPLVAGKDTFVRLFGRIVNASDGQTNMSFWPPAVLFGDQGGAPLPGSPLAPFRSSALTPNAGDRTNQNDGFWFRLPEEWTQRGAITLRGVINPNRTVNETSFANNSRSYTAAFVNKVPLCMVMKPTRTRLGTIQRYHPDMQRMFDYIEALLPTSRLRVIWGGGVIEEPYDPFHWIGDGGPFEVSEADDDGWTMLIELNTRKVFTSTRYCDGAGGFDHYVAMLKFQEDRAWNGFAQVGNGDIGLTVAPSAFFVLPYDTRGIPSSALVECQELSHNYGRSHVDCGDPSNVDHGYPYPPDVLSTPEAGYIGFDPIRNRLILPDQAKDFMSYCTPKWISDYTWKALFNRISTASMPAAAALEPAANGSPMVLIQGVYDPHEGLAGFKQALPLSGPSELAAAQALIAGLKPDSQYEMRAYSGTALQNLIPVYMQSLPADEGARDGLLVIALAQAEAGVDRIDFVNVQSNAVVRSLLGGGASPAVSVITPGANESLVRSNALEVKWTASDPDNDPLVFTVRFSNDSGAHWQVLASGETNTLASFDTAGIPGSDKCIIEVIASDGILCGSAQSGIFSLEGGSPQPFISVETGAGRIPDPLVHAFARAGEPIIFQGVAFDAEDGDIDDASLFWNISGPVMVSATGRELRAAELPPGSYTVMLTAADLNKNVGHAQMALTIDPHYVESAVMPAAVDGFAEDSAYLADPLPLPVRYASNSPAAFRTVRSGDKLYIGVTGLRVGADANSWVGVLVDTNGSGGNVLTSGEIRFDAFLDGRFRTMTGNGSTFIQDAAPAGAAAAVSSDGQFWSAEFEIDLDRLGGWNGQTIGVAVGHYHIDASGEVNRFWPASAVENNPSTWGAMVLGTDPNNPEDKDGDGLPDKWELAELGGTKQDSLDDGDKDGMNNGQEFVSGTDPAESSSKFAITIDQTPDGVALSWPVSDGRTYEVYRSDDLTYWDPVTLGMESGSWLDPGRDARTSFYRVRVNYGRYSEVY